MAPRVTPGPRRVPRGRARQVRRQERRRRSLDGPEGRGSRIARPGSRRTMSGMQATRALPQGAPKRAPAGEAIDVFMCVHGSDVGPRLGASIASYLLNFEPKGQLHFVTNDTERLSDFL